MKTAPTLSLSFIHYCMSSIVFCRARFPVSVSDGVVQTFNKLCFFDVKACLRARERNMSPAVVGLCCRMCTVTVIGTQESTLFYSDVRVRAADISSSFLSKV